MENEEEKLEDRVLNAGNIEEEKFAERERLELEIMASPKELNLL